VLLLADTHLGYAWAQRRRGELGPLVDGGARARLEALLAELAPRELVLAGDVVHAPNPHPEERSIVEDTLRHLMARTRLTIVRGNHDRAFLRDYAGLSLAVDEHWRGHGVVALHGDRLPERREPEMFYAAGHIHPVLLIHDNAGASRRIPVFVAGRYGVLLPAFSPFSAGCLVNDGLPPEMRRLIAGRSRLRLFAATGRRIVPLGSLAPAVL
jgi:metallophosphoesterase superfamily enzyme